MRIPRLIKNFPLVDLVGLVEGRGLGLEPFQRPYSGVPLQIQEASDWRESQSERQLAPGGGGTSEYSCCGTISAQTPGPQPTLSGQPVEILFPRQVHARFPFSTYPQFGYPSLPGIQTVGMLYKAKSHWKPLLGFPTGSKHLRRLLPPAAACCRLLPPAAACCRLLPPASQISGWTIGA
jgi:hypothetical protein